MGEGSPVANCKEEELRGLLRGHLEVGCPCWRIVLLCRIHMASESVWGQLGDRNSGGDRRLMSLQKGPVRNSQSMYSSKEREHCTAQRRMWNSGLHRGGGWERRERRLLDEGSIPGGGQGTVRSTQGDTKAQEGTADWVHRWPWGGKPKLFPDLSLPSPV